MKKGYDEMKKLSVYEKNLWKRLSESIDFISAKFNEYEHERQEKDKLIISDMKTDMLIMNEKMEKLEEIVDRQEQTNVAIASC